MYKFAAQHALRFPSARGYLTVEQLFHLPLKSANGYDLDSIAKTINTALKEASEESFVEVKSDPAKKQLEIALEIVKDVIKTRQDAIAAQENRAKKAEQRKKILDAIAAKKDSQLSSATMEELEKQLEALEVATMNELEKHLEALEV